MPFLTSVTGVLQFGADENLEQFGVDWHGRLLGCLTALYQRCRDYPRPAFCGTIASMTFQMLAGCCLVLGALPAAPPRPGAAIRTAAWAAPAGDEAAPGEGRRARRA